MFQSVWNVILFAFGSILWKKHLPLSHYMEVKDGQIQEIFQNIPEDAGNEYKIPNVLSSRFSDDDIFTLLSQVSNLAVVGIIYTNIPTVGGWSVWEILLLYGYLLFSEGWVNFFFQGSWKIAQMVNKSEIDRFLVRPLPTGMQMAASRIDFDGLNKMIIALGILSVGIKNCKINWTIIKILYFVVSLLTASMIRFCMIWLASCMSFWMQGPKNSLNYLVLSVGEMAKYPLIIYPGLLKGIFGYIIPYAYISYYPAGFLLGKRTCCQDVCYCFLFA